MKLAVARVPLVTLNDCAKAAPIQRRLANAGIAAEIDDELLEKLWFVSKEESDARIDVPMDELERAQKLLFEWDASEGILREAIRCPECRSLQVHYPQFAHRSLIPNLMMGFLARIGLIEKEYIARTVITRGRKTEPSAPFCIRRESPIVSSTQSNKPCCGRSRRNPSRRANGLPGYSELGLSITEIRTAGVVIASG
jgi:hypothetical protein